MLTTYNRMNTPSFEQKHDNFYKTFNSFEHIYVYVIQFEIKLYLSILQTLQFKINRSMFKTGPESTQL